MEAKITLPITVLREMMKLLRIQRLAYTLKLKNAR